MSNKQVFLEDKNILNLFKKEIKVKGFTLMDILVVVAIVSLLSSIVLFNLAEGRKKAEDTHMQTETGQVALAVEMYKLSNNGATPLKVRSSSTPRGTMYQENSDKYNIAMDELVDSGYISEIPRSPDGESYYYGENEAGTEAVFSAKLKTPTSIASNTQNSCSIVNLAEYCTPLMPPVCTPLGPDDNPEDEVCFYFSCPEEIPCTGSNPEDYCKCI